MVMGEFRSTGLVGGDVLSPNACALAAQHNSTPCCLQRLGGGKTGRAGRVVQRLQELMKDSGGG